MKKILKRNEFYLAVVLVVLCLVIGLKNPSFFSMASFIDLAKGATVSGIMAFGLLLAIIVGGVDISFPAMAVASMFTVCKFADAVQYDGPVIVLILAAALLGALMGLLNGWIIAKYQLPALIVTLGTSRVFYGIMAISLGLVRISEVAPALKRMSNTALMTVSTERMTTMLPITALIFVLVIVLTYFLLNHTLLGKMIYSVGGNPVAAVRVGYPVKGITMFAYAYVGFCAGLAGIAHAVQARIAIPTDLYGGEMQIIAMVVLGGAMLTGGKGTVLGTVLGIAIVTVANNSLILLGVPTTWQRFVLGLIILLGTGVSSYQQLLASRKRVRVLEDTTTKQEVVQHG